MIPIERFNEIVEEELKLLPAYVFEELNGGVVVDEKVNLHPKRMADDLYIMGTYSSSPTMGKQIVIYYGSFSKTMPFADEETLRMKIRDTLRHEFRHHMETRAGFFGKGTLIDEDKQEMDRYYLMHAKKEESSGGEGYEHGRTDQTGNDHEGSGNKKEQEKLKIQEEAADRKENTEEIQQKDDNITTAGQEGYCKKERDTIFVSNADHTEAKTDEIIAEDDTVILPAGFSGVRFVSLCGKQK